MVEILFSGIITISKCMLFCLREWVVHAIAQLDNAVLSVDFFNLMFSGSDWTKACVLIQKVVFEWSSL